MQLLVPIASVATLRLLWLVQLSKSMFSCEWPAPLPRDQPVELVLRLGAYRIGLPARVRSCMPAGAGYHVNLRLDPLSDGAQAELQRVIAGEAVARS